MVSRRSGYDLAPRHRIHLRSRGHRMNIKHVIAATFVLVCSLPLSVSADRESDARPKIQSRYDQFNKAYTKKDFKTVSEIFSPDCVMKLNSEGRSMKASRAIMFMKAVS